MSTVTQTEPARTETPRGGGMIYRHAVVIRVTHWINLICMTVLLMSGLQIFNAHPALYWGERSDFARPILAMVARRNAAEQPIGVTTIFGHDFDTTGVLGFADEGGFPAWATLPGSQWLAMGRRLHFFFAWIFVVNGAIYAAYAVLSGHFWRDLLPSRRELPRIGRTLWDSLRLRFPKGEAAKRYNVVQKISYLVVVLVLGPLIILTGLALSPRLDAGFPVLLTLFDGRQSARTIHFICTFALLGFVLIHLVMVLVSGLWNNLRSMITGRYHIGSAGGGHGH